MSIHWNSQYPSVGTYRYFHKSYLQLRDIHNSISRKGGVILNKISTHVSLFPIKPSCFFTTFLLEVSFRCFDGPSNFGDRFSTFSYGEWGLENNHEFYKAIFRNECRCSSNDTYKLFIWEPSKPACRLINTAHFSLTNNFQCVSIIEFRVSCCERNLALWCISSLACLILTEDISPEKDIRNWSCI